MENASKDTKKLVAFLEEIGATNIQVIDEKTATTEEIQSLPPVARKMLIRAQNTGSKK